MNGLLSRDFMQDRDYGDPFDREPGAFECEQWGWHDAKGGKAPQSEDCFYLRGYEAFKAQLIAEFQPI